MNNLLKQYLDLALITSYHSHDDETAVGVILVDRNTKLDIAKYTNQFIRHDLAYQLPRTRPNKYHYIQHAEAKLIYHCAKHGIATNHCVLISTHSPCLQCMRLLYQSGIKTIYFKTFHKSSDIVNDVLDLKVNLKKLKSGYYKMKLSIRI